MLTMDPSYTHQFNFVSHKGGNEFRLGSYSVYYLVQVL